MRNGLISLLLLFTLSVSAQFAGRYPIETASCTGAESIWLVNNNSTDSKGNHNLTANGGLTYVTSSPTPAEGTHCANLNASGRYFSSPAINLGNDFTFIFEVYTGATGAKTIVSNYTSDDGFWLFADIDGDDITFYTGNGSLTDNATALNCGLSASAWMQIAVVVDRSAGTAVIYLDGSDVTTDGTIRTDFDNTTAFNIGATTVPGSYLFGYVDAMQLYLWGLSSGNITTINTTPGTEVCE